MAIDQPLRVAVEDIVQEVFEQYSPGLWSAAPASMKRAMIRRVQDKAPEMIEEIMAKVGSDLNAVFDLKDMVVSNLLRDKPLLNRIFQ